MATFPSSPLQIDETTSAVAAAGARTRYTVACPPTPSHALARVVTRNCRNWSDYDASKPIAGHTRLAFDRILPQLLSAPSVVLDSGCGAGRSTRWLQSKHPNSLVLGVDRSLVRLSRSTWTPRPMRTSQENYSRAGAAGTESESESESDSEEPFVVNVSDNVMLVRAELGDFWRLLHRHRIQIDHHYLLYPNPYPKLSRLSQRWYGHPSFPLLATLHRNSLTIRSNWPTYLDEFAASARIVYQYHRTDPGTSGTDACGPGNSGINSCPDLRANVVHQPTWIVPSDDAPWTHFEAKYRQAGEPCYELRIGVK